jgi:hypothetical protein
MRIVIRLAGVLVCLLGQAAFATPARTVGERPAERTALRRPEVKAAAGAPTATLLARFDTRAETKGEHTSAEVFKEIFVPAHATSDSLERRLGFFELPEPAAFALIGSGLLALGILRRRRQI